MNGLASPHFAAPAEVAVRVARQDDAFQVEATLMVAVEQRLAWPVLIDYDNLAGFVPCMRSSRIVSRAGEPLLLEQKGESGLLLFKVPIEVVSRIDEAPFEAIGFQSVGGTLKNQTGQWALDRHDHATRVTSSIFMHLQHAFYQSADWITFEDVFGFHGWSKSQ